MSDSDSWETPQTLFDELDREFNFSVDVCATEENSKCPLYIPDCLSPFPWCLAAADANKLSDFELSFIDTSVATYFMNPPYSNPLPFIQRAWEESKSYVAVCLVKVDTSTKWWGVFWDYDKNKPKSGCQVRFFPKRIKFAPPKGFIGKAQGPSFPSALIIMDRRNICAI